VGSNPTLSARKQAKKKSLFVNSLVTGTVRVTDKDGAGHFVSFISFAESAITALLSLAEGASVSLSGSRGLRPTPPPMARCAPS
jgi:hypothetical protein